MNLYELNSEYSRIVAEVMDCAEQNEGEISSELEKALEDIEISIEEKIENTALYIKNLDAEAEMIKAEEKKLAERRKACENRASSACEYLARFMGKNKFSSARVSISAHVDKSLNYSTESLKVIPVEYQRDVVKKEIDKDKVRKAMENGEHFYFCRWVEKKRVK